MANIFDIIKYSIYIVPLIIMILESIFINNKEKRIIRVLTSMQVALVMLFIFILVEETTYVKLNGHLIKNGLIQIFELILLVITFITIRLMKNAITSGSTNKITEETLILIYTSTIGMLISMEAHNLITLFLSLELSSICFYIIALRKNSNRKSMEGGLKYFIIGGIVSTIVLLGLVNIYKETGSVMYSDIALMLIENPEIGIRLEVGIFLLVLGLIIKIGIAPFHGWLIDTYEGAGMLNTFYLTVTQKVVTIIVLINLYKTMINEINMEIIQSMMVIGILSTLIIGTMGSLRQEKIIRFVAYSAIVNSALLIMFWVGGNIDELISYSIFYLINYAIGLLVLFEILIGLKKNINEGEIDLLNDLRNLWYSHKLVAIILIIVLLNLAGLPPFTNFISKLILILPLMVEGRMYMAMIILFLTVGLMIYYVNVMRLIIIDRKQKIIGLKLRAGGERIMAGVLWIIFAEVFLDEIINIIKIIVTISQ